MNWENRYLAPSNALWQGRLDTPADSCFFQQIQLLDLNDPLPTSTGLAFGLLGFRCDEGIRRNQGRVGAAEGPLAIRDVLAKLPLQRPDSICYDAGDIICIDNDLELAQQTLGEAVHLLLKQGIIPIVLGGGHELAWGHFQGIAKAFPTENLGIVNFDAHLDMRPLLSAQKGSSGTPFLQMATAHHAQQRPFHYHCIGVQPAANIPALFATAKHHHAKITYAEALQQPDTSHCMTMVNDIIYDHEMIYLSLCLDVFASAYAPGVSAPQALGVTPWQVIPLLRTLAESGKVISYDLAELSPKYDIDQRTAKLAANLIHDIIHHHRL